MPGTVGTSPHLLLDGQCRTIATMLTYGESPMASQFEPRRQGRILHATLQLGDIELIGADVLPQDYRKPQSAIFWRRDAW
jgi:uncharacterized glyoxalase superfamily protein PhnB